MTLPLPKWPFGTFMEHCHGVFRQCEKETPNWWIPPLSQSHVFWVGEDEDFTSQIKEIRDDLIEEIKTQIPLPFQDISIVSVVRRERAESKPDGRIAWTMDRVIENPSRFITIPKLKEKTQDFAIIRYQHMEDEAKLPLPMVFLIRYYGLKNVNGQVHFEIGFQPSDFIRDVSKTCPEIEDILMRESKVILEGIASISHPANYVIQVKPKLTSHEERRIACGKNYPGQKQPHFIVVDHEVLVRMRSPVGTHASPTPHERRGHWRRLAERCRHAKLMGRDKTFVKPHFVGDPKWSDQKNLYEVIPDLVRRETK